jgi:hypothetical protein
MQLWVSGANLQHENERRKDEQDWGRASFLQSKNPPRGEVGEDQRRGGALSLTLWAGHALPAGAD